MRWASAAAMPALWALGWTVTTLGQIHVEEQFTIFGAYGALTFSAVSGLLLHVLLPVRTTGEGHPGLPGSRRRHDSAEHVSSGTGAIGMATFEALRRRGDRVRLGTDPATPPFPTTSRWSGVTLAIRASPPCRPGC